MLVLMVFTPPMENAEEQATRDYKSEPEYHNRRVNTPNAAEIDEDCRAAI